MADVPKAPSGAYFINSSGETVRVPLEQAQEAGQLGWVPASPEQVKNLKTEEKYGTAGQQLKTGLEGAAQALTLGTSTYAEKALGVDPEDIAGREAANPFAHGVGEAIGVAAPLVLSGGAAAGPEAGAMATARGAAELTAPSLIAKAGKAAGAGVEALLPEATGVAGRVASGAAEGLASGAVEGGLYGAGHVVHESALGDPNLTAESAIEEIGLGALLGGSIAGAGGVLGGLTREAASSQLGKKISDWLPEFEGERNIKAAGAIQSDIRQAEKRVSREELTKIGREAGDLGLVGPFSTPGKVLEKSEALMDSAGAKMGDILDAADTAPGAVRPSIRPILNRMDLEVLAPLEKNPLEKATANQVRQLISDYSERYAPELGQNPTFRGLHELRREIDRKLYGLRGVADPSATEFKSALRDIRGIVGDEINTSLDASGLGSAAWKQANREYQVGAQMAKFAESGVSRAHGNNPLGLLSVISGATGFATHGLPGGFLLGLGAEASKRFGSSLAGSGARALRGFLEKGAAEGVINKTAEAIAAERSAGTDSLAAAATRAPESVAALSQLQRSNEAVQKRIDALTQKLMSGATTVRHAAPGLIGSGMAHNVEEQMAQVRQLAGNAQMAQDALVRNTEDLHEHAPNTSQALQVTQARALAFLSAKAPTLPTPGPLGPKLSLSQHQKWTWGRYFNAVNKPTSVLEHAAKGTLTPLDVEAVRETAPHLHQKMVQTALEKVAAHKGPIPYQSRLMLAFLAGHDLDGTLSPSAILANQAVYQRPSAKSGEDATGPGALRPSQHGMDKLTVGRRALLPGQASEARRDRP